MLAGLLFLGVIAASAMPDIMSSLRGSAEDDVDAPEDAAPEGEAAGTQESILDRIDVSEGGGDGDDGPQSEGIDLFTDPPAGITEVDAFQPGADTLTIQIPDEADSFTLSNDPEAGTASLGYEIEAGAVEIRFNGMDEVPMDDIYLRVSDASSPTGDADIALSTVIEPEEPGGEADELSPVDPSLPDGDPTDPTDPEIEEQILFPVDPTLPDGPTEPLPDDPFPGDEQVLLPVMDDIAPEPVHFVAPLAPDTTPEDDIADLADRDPLPLEGAVLGVDHSDTDAAAEGSPGVVDTFWLYPPQEGEPAAVAEVANFTPGEDFLRISLDRAPGGDAGVVSVTGSDDGLDAVVRVDGVAIAILKGAPGASTGDIFVETRPELFA